MNYTISNEKFTLVISSKGGEFQSIKDAEGQEYLWQGDAATWTDRGPNLFPYIGRMTEKSYKYQDTVYHMDIHGFAKDSVFPVRKQGKMNWCLQWKIPGKLWNSIHFIFVLRSDICLRKIL